MALHDQQFLNQVGQSRPRIFNLQRAGQAEHAMGEFRAWAGYKTLGSDVVTGGLAHLQHVLSFAGTDVAGRTGVHAHLAHAHIVIPTSGRGVFSYDGIATPALPGMVIVQHGGTVHDQFEYSYAAASAAENRATPLSVEPTPTDAPPRSFGFIELFVPRKFANVEIVPPAEVTPELERTAWDHPYHVPGARFSLQAADAPGAAYRPLAGSPGLEIRDCATWEPSAGLVATWIVRPGSDPPADGLALAPVIEGEADGVDILTVITGSVAFARPGGVGLLLHAGDTLTCSQGWLGDIAACSPDMSLLRFFIAARAADLPRATPEEIARLEALGPGIVTRSEIRPEGDTRPINGLRQP